MQGKLLKLGFVTLLLLLLGTGVALAAMREPPPPDAAPAPAVQSGGQADAGAVRARAAVTYNTVITINSTVDTSGEYQYTTCYYDSSVDGSGLFGPASDGKCNLRRALVEASHRLAKYRPILIKFNIPITDPNYNAITGTWTVVMDADYSSSAGGEAIVQGTLDNPKNPNSFITIDGNTQPGGRTNGYPKIIINSANSFDLVGVSYNTIRNLAFNGGGGVFLNDVSGVGGHNTVENVWVGLNADGTEIVPGSNPNVSLAGGGIDIQGDYNTISGTTVTGSNIGIRVQGDHNLLQYNQIGTRGDGTVPASRLFCDSPAPVYDPAEWYGGWGIQFLNGSFNQVLSNTLAGIHTPHSATETFPPAIATGGATNLFAYNIIGIDSSGAEVGVCGQGFHVTGVYSAPAGIQVMSNTIVNAHSSFLDSSTNPPKPTEGAIYVNESSPLALQFTMRNNIVRNSTSKVIEFGPAITDTLRLFEPPKIIIISDTLVVGETQPGYDCPNCLIELYLDDLTEGQDALELLTTAVVQNITGTARFTATLPRPLAAGEGIRLTATTQDPGVIGIFRAGTTTKMSPAYGPDAIFTRDLGPGWNLFSFDVTPASTAITDVLASLAGQYDVVLAFEGGPLGGGRTYEPGNAASDLTTMDSLHGYWIHITAANTQTLTMNFDPTYNDTEITLYEGWNLVSYLPDRTWPVTVALESIAGTYDLVQSYDGGGKTYIAADPQFSDLTEMAPGFAYWIHIKQGMGTQTLIYPPYYALRQAGAPQSRETAAQGVAATDFFTPTTEWADFYGVATLSGHSAPRGATILAYDPDGVIAGAFTVQTPGLYGVMHVYGDDPRTPEDEGAVVSDTLTFTIADRPATPQQGKQLVWNGRGALSNINISAEIPYTATTEWADFYGSLTVQGQPAAVGTLLAVYDSDGVYIGDFRVTKAGQYGFLHAYGDDPTTTVDEGATSGDSLSFRLWLPDGSGPFVATPDVSPVTWGGRGSRTQVNFTSSGQQPGAPTEVVISGPTTGQPGTPYTFTITVNPADVTTPISYTITRTDAGAPLTASLGRVVNYRNVQWATTGTKYITVTADNGLGVVTGTHTIVIGTAPPTATVVAPTGVTLDGPRRGLINTPYTFTATVSPADVTTPLTYTLSRTGGSPSTTTGGQTQAFGGLQWATPGLKVLTVTAQNSGGTASGHHRIRLIDPTPDVVTVTTTGTNTTFADGTQLVVPGGVVTQPIIFTYTETVSPTQGITREYGFAGRSFTLIASRPFSGLITLTLTYSDEELADAGISDEASLRLYYWTGSRWQDVVRTCPGPGTLRPDYVRDTTNNTLTAPICHLSEFGMFAPTAPAQQMLYLPLVVKN
ncbi:MAG: hypothetical protein D6796_10810 [Caldilineae bacterium]|nr:MAG: hypothetical protein D6796_10810 [Caldilineae bacterium]